MSVSDLELCRRRWCSSRYLALVSVKSEAIVPGNGRSHGRSGENREVAELVIVVVVVANSRYDLGSSVGNIRGAGVAYRPIPASCVCRRPARRGTLSLSSLCGLGRIRVSPEARSSLSASL